MIQLIQITDPIKLEEYHRFRYNIYRKSGKEAFLKDNSGLDKDNYDNHAIHLGCYVKGHLAGCVRFVFPQYGNAPLQLHSHTPVKIRASVNQWINDLLDQNKSFIEVSRICIRPEYRNVKNIKEFVLATMETAHNLFLDHAVITVDKHHAKFWRYMGFEILEKTDLWNYSEDNTPAYCMVYNYYNLPKRITDSLIERKNSSKLEFIKAA